MLGVHDCSVMSGSSDSSMVSLASREKNKLTTCIYKRTCTIVSALDDVMIGSMDLLLSMIFFNNKKPIHAHVNTICLRSTKVVILLVQNLKKRTLHVNTICLRSMKVVATFHSVGPKK